MSVKEMESRAREVRELMRMREELDTEIEAIKDEIKAAMGDCEQVIVGEYKISYKAVESRRLDTGALKKIMPEILDLYTVTTKTRRFQIA